MVMKLRFALLLFLSLPMAVRAQDGLEGLEWTNKEASSGRAYMGIGGEKVHGSLFSWSFTHGADGVIRVSMNPLFTFAALPAVQALPHQGGSRAWGLFLLFLVPQVLGNFNIQYPLIPRHCYLTVADRTDYYLFNSPAKIYMEGSVGLRLFVGSIGGEVRWVWPITQGYLENKKPYLGFNLYLAQFRKQETRSGIDSSAPY